MFNLFYYRHLTKFIIIFLVISGCGGMQRVMVGSSAKLLYNASSAIETESNWENFRRGVMPNLKTIEGLLYLDPENNLLLISLIKGYSGYAFIVNETLYLKDYFAENDEVDNLNQAIYNYSTALKYGIRFLKINGIDYNSLIAKQREKVNLQKLFDSKLKKSKAYLEGMLFTAQSMGSLVNLQRDKMSLVPQLSIVKEMFDWVCSSDPKINFGACDIFYGSYYGGRPRIMGGDSKLGKRYFTDSFKAYPDNWLTRVLYIQNYLIPISDEVGYQKEKKFLDRALKIHNEDISWTPYKTDEKGGKSFENSRLRLYQTVALKRYEIIKRFEKDIF